MNPDDPSLEKQISDLSKKLNLLEDQLKALRQKSNRLEAKLLNDYTGLLLLLYTTVFIIYLIVSR